MDPFCSAASASIRPADLLRVWNERADYLQQYGDPNSARLWRLAAVELERSLKEFGDETLTVADAARVTGYTSNYISKQIAAGSIPNAGRKNAPRVRRGDLKAKPQNGRGRPRCDLDCQGRPKLRCARCGKEMFSNEPVSPGAVCILCQKDVTPISKLKRR